MEFQDSPEYLDEDELLAARAAGEVDPQQWSGVLRLDPGTKIETTADAIQAWAFAKDGLAHRWEGDDLAGAEEIVAAGIATVVNHVETTWLSGLFRGIENGWRSYSMRTAVAEATVGLPLHQPGSEMSPIEQAAAAEEARRQGSDPASVERDDALQFEADSQANIAVSSATLAAGRMNNLQATGMGHLEALLQADEEVTLALASGELDIEEVRAKVKDEIYGDFRQRVDNRPQFQRFLVDEVGAPAMELAATYDAMVHLTGLTILATPDAIQNEFDQDPNTTFLKAYEEAYNDKNVATYLGIEPGSSFATWVNLGASVAFDAITWLTPGARVSWAWMTELLTNPAMTATLLSQKHFRSGIRQMVNATDSRLSYSFIGGGMNGDDVARLYRISQANIPRGGRPQATKDVIKILTRAVDDQLYTPPGPAQFKFIKDVQGMRVPFQNAAALTENQRRQLGQMLARASKDRSAPLTDDFVEWSMNLGFMRWGDDMPAGYMDEVIDVWEKTRRGSDLSGAATTLQMQHTNGQIDDVMRELSEPSLRQVRHARDSLPGLDSRIAQLELVDDAASFRQLKTVRTSRDALQAHVDEFGGAYDDAMRRRETYANKLAGIETDAQTLGLPRDVTDLERFIHEQYDDWGRALDLPEIDRIHPILGDRNLLDWTLISGDDVAFPSDESIAGLLGWVGGDIKLNKNLVDQAYTYGMGARQGGTVTPVSPFQMLAYANSPNKGVYTWMQTEAGRNVSKWAFDTPQTILASMVLLNPVTAMRVHLDEIGRFIEDAGFTFETMVKASFPSRIGFRLGNRGFGLDVPGMEVSPQARQATREGVTASATPLADYTMVDPSKGKNWQAAERWVDGTMLEDDVFRGYARAVQAGGDDTAEVERLFKEWWNVGSKDVPAGHLYHRRTTLNVGRFDLLDDTQKKQAVNRWLRSNDGTSDDAVRALKANQGGVVADLNDHDAWLMVNQIWDEFTLNIREGSVQQFSGDILDAAANGRKLTDPRYGRPGKAVGYEPMHWRQFGPVPGQDRSPHGLLNRGWNMLFGTPSQRRGTIIYDRSFEWKRGVLYKRFEGRIITVEALMDDQLGPGLSLFDANAAIQAGERSQIIRGLKMNRWYFPYEIDNAAARYAANVSDSMMYQMGAVSVLGKKASRLYPWGRAQADWIGYWGKKMLEPSQFRIPGSGVARGVQRRAAGGKFPFRGGSAEAAAAVPPPRVYTPDLAIGGRSTNVANIRLMDRVGHLIALGETPDVGRIDPDLTEGPREDREPRGQPGSPQWFLNNYAFIPTAFDDQFVYKTTFAPTPLAGNLVNFIDRDSPLGPVRNVFEEFNPSHRAYNDYTNHGIEGIFNFLNSVAPAEGRSTRKTFEMMLKTFMGSAFVDENGVLLNGMIDTLMIEGEAAYFPDYAAMEMMEWLGEHAYDGSMFPAGEDGSADNLREREMVAMGSRITKRSYSREGSEHARNLFGIQSSYGSEAVNAKAYLGMEAFLPALVASGAIPQSKADEFYAIAAEIGPALESDQPARNSVTVKQRKALVDVASEILWHSNITEMERSEYQIAQPWSAVNMTHWQEVDTERVPDEWADAVQGNRIRRDLTGERRRDLVEQGRAEGWVGRRPWEEWFGAVGQVVYRAGRTWLREAWTEQSGLPWREGKKDLLKLRLTIDRETANRYGGFIDKLQVDDAAVVDGWEQPDGTWVTTYGDFKEFLTQGRHQMFFEQTSDNTKYGALRQNQHGREFVKDYKQTLGWLDRQGIDQPEDWHLVEADTPMTDGEDNLLLTPDGDLRIWAGAEIEKENYRNWLGDLVSTSTTEHGLEEGWRLEGFTEGTYNAQFAWELGPIDYQEPDPPPIAELDNKVTAPGGVGPEDQWRVIDGDTIDYRAADGQHVRFRLMGINAPEDPNINQDALDAKKALTKMIAEAETVTIGQFNVDRYGTTQRFYTIDPSGDGLKENERVFGWLYIDGIPV
jgi:hypothetical protein